MPQKYEPKNPDEWLVKLTTGQYKNVTSARKAIAHMQTWTPAQKARGVELADRYFASPTRFNGPFQPPPPVDPASLSLPPLAKQVDAPTVASLNAVTATAAGALREAKLDRKLQRVRTLAASAKDVATAYAALTQVPSLDLTPIHSVVAAMSVLAQGLTSLSNEILSKSE